ncbi:MAG TPA: heme-binding protein [Xanthobacteraceae bacterium]|nr:heme-binding protein [Xanthobacteraceae bacterium]
MKLYIGLLAAAAATALIGPGLVNTSLAADGDNFVIRGDATKTILEQNEINVATAEAVSKACVDEAVKQGVKVSISVFDQFGELVYLYRMDGQTKVAVDTAMMKARTVLNTRQPSKATMNAVLSGRSSELRQQSFGNFANSGGLPIVINGNQFIGAIGVGGSAPKLPEWSDEICAWRALTKVMGPQPALLPDVQRTQ